MRTKAILQRVVASRALARRAPFRLKDHRLARRAGWSAFNGLPVIEREADTWWQRIAGVDVEEHRRNAAAAAGNATVPGARA
jgi:hypothetical protein